MKNLLALLTALTVCTPILACGTSYHPCAMAYKKAVDDCPQCTAEELDARIAEVDKDCGHLVLSTSSSAPAPEGGAK